MSILGLTLDYGPYGFMDRLDICELFCPISQILLVLYGYFIFESKDLFIFSATTYFSIYSPLQNYWNRFGHKGVGLAVPIFLEGTVEVVWNQEIIIHIFLDVYSLHN